MLKHIFKGWCRKAARLCRSDIESVLKPRREKLPAVETISFPMSVPSGGEHTVFIAFNLCMTCVASVADLRNCLELGCCMVLNNTQTAWVFSVLPYSSVQAPCSI